MSSEANCRVMLETKRSAPSTYRIAFAADIRRQLLDGDHPRLTFSPHPRARRPEIGHAQQVGPSRWIVIVRLNRTRKGLYSAAYEEQVSDHPRLLKRVPTVPASEMARLKRELDANGVAPEPTEESKKRAAEESSYTGSPGLAVDDAGEAVPIKYQEQITGEADDRSVAVFRAERYVIRSAITRLLEQDPAFGPYESKLRFLERKFDEIGRQAKKQAA